MLIRHFRAVFLFVFWLPLVAAEFQAEPAVAVRFRFNDRWDLMVLNRARVAASENDWFDVSVAPYVRYQARPRLRLEAGAYLSSIRSADGGRTRVYRPFLRIVPRLYSNEHVVLTTRSGFERFLVVGRDTDLNRFRQRLRLRWKGKWAPYVSTEVFFVRSGLLKSRFETGFQRSLPRGSSIKVSYRYDAADLFGAGLSHVVVTTFNLNFREHR